MPFRRFSVHGTESVWRTKRSVCRNDPYSRLCGRSPSLSAGSLLYDMCALWCIYILPELHLRFHALLLQMHINFSYCLHQEEFLTSSHPPDEPESDYPSPCGYQEPVLPHGNPHGFSLKLYLLHLLSHLLQWLLHLPQNVHGGQGSVCRPDSSPVQSGLQG